MQLIRVIINQLLIDQQDKNYLLDRTRYIGTDKNFTNVGISHYPALTNTEIKEGHIRLGEHCDIGGLTLLFQDSMGGLEVRIFYRKFRTNFLSPINTSLFVFLTIVRHTEEKDYDKKF